jgi:hypothetical protein
MYIFKIWNQPRLSAKEKRKKRTSFFVKLRFYKEQMGNPGILENSVFLSHNSFSIFFFLEVKNNSSRKSTVQLHFLRKIY